MRFQLRAEWLAGEDAAKAARGLESFNAANEADSRWAAETKLRLATRLAAAGQNDQALTFVAALVRDPVPRHAGFELVAGLITATGDDKKILAYLKSETRLKPEDRVALLRGMAGALKEKPVAAPEEASETQ